jgi:hypothetical protein
VSSVKAGESKLPVDAAEHVAEGDLRRRLDQQVAAFLAAHALHDSAGFQLDEDCRQDVRRCVVFLGDDVESG